MTSLWPKIEIKSSFFDSPKRLFEEQAEILPNITNNIVSAEVSKTSFELPVINSGNNFFESINSLQSINNPATFFLQMLSKDKKEDEFNIDNWLTYRFDLIGNLLDNYRFKVLTFSFDLNLYPVYFFHLDPNIVSELNLKRDKYGCLKEVNGKNELESFLKSVLFSQRITEIIDRIIKLSK